MSTLHCCYLFVLITCCYAVSQQLKLNPLAELVHDVKSVTHDLPAREVIISLAKKRHCSHPTFMVRLSGQSLYLLDQVTNNDTQSSTVVFRYPYMHEAGTYFLEVLTLYCETLDPSAFSDMCLISPQEEKNVLTLPYSFKVSPSELSTIRRPRWVLRKNITTPALLPTRYQKLKMCDGKFCKSEESELDQHNSYDWTDKPPFEHLMHSMLHEGLHNLSTHTGAESITYCMVGASHARNLASYGNELQLERVHFVWIDSHYPQLLEIRHLVNCSYAVLGYGQWPLSVWMGRKPYNAETFETLVRSMLGVIKASNLHTQVFMRSMNLNSLGAGYTRCPSGDFRHPPIVMMYNGILSRASAAYDIPYIDTFHLQAPLWDGALDWGHPSAKVYKAEVEYMLHYTLAHSHKTHRAPVLHPPPLLSEMLPIKKGAPMIKFTDSDTVFTVFDDVLRAFPDMDTKVRMGYNTNNFTMVDASKKSLYSFGPPFALV